MRIPIAALVAVLLLAPDAPAGIWDDTIEVTTAATETVSLLCVPDGSGRPLTEARMAQGFTVDATIVVTLTDVLANPVVGYPAEDLWLESSLGGVAFCGYGAIADGPTGPDGSTTFTAPLACGGHSDSVAGERLDVSVNGYVRPGESVDILINSPDLNGDLEVDLSDTILFCGIYLGGAYDYAADYAYDGALNLSDLVLFSQALNAACGP